MHGTVHDFVVINTVVNGGEFPSGENPMALVKQYIPDYKGLKTPAVFPRVLEVGSLDINGNMRDYDFHGIRAKWRDLCGVKEYIGIDLMEGKNVDHVMDAHHLKFADNSFDLVLCLSVLEHDSDPLTTVKEAHRVLKTGQPLIVTTVNENHEEHKDLGGAETEIYNKFTHSDIYSFFLRAGFEDYNIKIIGPKTEILAYATK